MRSIARHPFFSLPVLLAVLLSCGRSAPPVDFSTLSEEARRLPENALASMHAAEGVAVQLFAAEPRLTNPTNLAVDARGRVWVCEANNYRLPYNPRFKERPAGDRILILEDTDGDGRADTTKVFYQGPEVNAALGIAVLGRRVIVSHSPNIYVFHDEDGDDRPERRDTLFTGIGGPDDDHGAHAVTFGPDGRYYFNFGNAGAQLLDKAGRAVVDQLGRPIRRDGKPYREGMAFRFDPDSSYVEVLGFNFRNNYELCVDPFGSVWQTDNDDDGNRGCRVNFVMEYGNYGYKDEITGAGWQERRPGQEADIPRRHWHQNDPGVAPNLLQTGAGSPAGIAFYTGDRLPEAFRNQMIHCEALQNVVRAYPVTRSGAGYTATIVDLLRSDDPWFRPSDVAVAPDGSVFVADWYDAGVGGNKMDDIQRGRIYRLAPDASTYQVTPPDLSTPEGAARALLSPNPDVNYQAWTRLRELGPAAEAALRELWTGPDPAHRARALWLLARLPGKTREYLDQALDDDNADVRVTALRAARQLDAPHLTDYVRLVARDPDAGVRREAAIALRFLGSPEASELWAELAGQYDGADRWYLEALGIGSDLHADARFAAWWPRAGDQWRSLPATRQIVWRVRAAATLPLLTQLVADPAVDTAWLPRYIRAFHFNPAAERDEALAGLVSAELPHSADVRRHALSQISPDYLRRNAAFRRRVLELLPSLEGAPEWFAVVRALRLRDETPRLMAYFLDGPDASLRDEAATMLFEFGGAALAGKHLAGLTEPDKKAFYARLGGVSHPAAVDLLARELDRPGQSYPLRVQLVEALGGTWDGQHLLFDRLREGALADDLHNTAAIKLMNCWDPEVRAAAPQYLTAAKGKGGELPPVHELVARRGDAARGKVVFSRHCYTCHQLDNLGTAFGPDLSAIGDKLAREAIYTSILYPSAGINFGYEGYLVRTKDGDVLSGILISETEQQLTLKMITGATRTIDRAGVASVEAMKQSLMTANLQALMTEGELVDLVEFLTTLKGKTDTTAIQ